MPLQEKVKAAALSVFSNAALIVMKVITGLVSGSVSILSEAIHSAMDLVAALIALFSVRISDNPPDKHHPYGHGKVENVSGVIEAILIFIAAGWIIFEATTKFFHPEEIHSIGIGSLVMFFSALVNILVSRHLYKVAHRTGSIALEADALHLKTDVYTSAGVGVGLLLIWITGLHVLDPVIAILVALLIIKESYHLMKRAFSPLVDASWQEDELRMLEQHLASLGVRFHDLKTRKAGNQKFAEFHIELPPLTPLQKAHEFCDLIENRLETEIANLRVTIHMEPDNYHDE